MDIQMYMSENYPDYSHYWVHSGHSMSPKEWENKSKPYLWHEVERDDIRNIVVFADDGHGALLVIKNGEELYIDLSGKQIILEDMVILDRDYWGTSSYIWVSACSSSSSM